VLFTKGAEDRGVAGAVDAPRVIMMAGTTGTVDRLYIREWSLGMVGASSLFGDDEYYKLWLAVYDDNPSYSGWDESPYDDSLSETLPVMLDAVPSSPSAPVGSLLRTYETRYWFPKHQPTLTVAYPTRSPMVVDRSEVLCWLVNSAEVGQTGSLSCWYLGDWGG